MLTPTASALVSAMLPGRDATICMRLDVHANRKSIFCAIKKFLGRGHYDSLGTATQFV